MATIDLMVSDVVELNLNLIWLLVDGSMLRMESKQIVHLGLQHRGIVGSTTKEIAREETFLELTVANMFLDKIKDAPEPIGGIHGHVLIFKFC